VSLVVNDGTANSASDTVTITTRNSAPVANAGPDQTVFVTQTVTLDGHGSSDVDGDTLSFAWSFVSRPNGSAATLADVVTHYNRARTLGLTAERQRELVEYLKSL